MDFRKVTPDTINYNNKVANAAQNRKVSEYIIIIMLLESARTHIYHSHFSPEEVVETPEIFFRDTYILPKWLSYEKYYRRDKW
jgi:hypothetical protein